jgi:hypothetical protein
MSKLSEMVLKGVPKRWHYRKVLNEFKVFDDTGHFIAKVDELENAPKVAASPDLYQALNATVAALEMAEGCTITLPNGVNAMIIDALAKYEGRIK